MRLRGVFVIALLFVINLSLLPAAHAQRPRRAAAGRPVIWRAPGNIPSRDLYYGPGSAALAPVAPFRFVKESKKGESPKFDVKDARGVVWTVKLFRAAKYNDATMEGYVQALRERINQLTRL